MVGRRPVLLLSRDSAYRVLNVANLDNVHVVARADLGSRIGVLPTPRVGEVKRALGYALGWPELKYRDEEGD